MLEALGTVGPWTKHAESLSSCSGAKGEQGERARARRVFEAVSLGVTEGF